MDDRRSERGQLNYGALWLLVAVTLLILLVLALTGRL